MNVLLVVLKFTAEDIVNPFIPIGTAYINGALRHDGGFHVQGCNMNYEGTDVLCGKIRGADVLLAGGTVKDWNKLTQLFALARRENPGIITVGGGASFTASPLSFCELTNVNYAVVGEGEITVPALLHALERKEDVRKILGVVYRENGSYAYTGDRPLIRDLDSIPFPSYKGLGLEKLFEQQRRIRRDKLQDKNFFLLQYEDDQVCREIPMLLSRSCPFQCKFCFHSVGNQYRLRSMDNFFRELDWLIEAYHINGIHLLDELFGLREDVISEFCDRIEQYHIGWFAEIRVETASAALLKRMRQAGCQNIQFGIENINAEILENMNKKITKEMIESALKNAYEAGVTVSGNILIGAENDTWERFLENFDWWNQNRRYLIHLILIEQYPGTAYFQNCLKRGVIRDENEFIRRGMPRVNMSRMSDYEWNKMLRMMQLSRINKGFQGPIRAVPAPEGDGKVCVEAACAHCGGTYSVTVAEQHWKNEDIFSSYCSCCGRLNTVDRREHKDFFQYTLLNQWISNETNHVRLEDWLRRQNYRRIGLVWDTPFAQLFFERLQTSPEVTIPCIVDEPPVTALLYPDQVYAAQEELGQYELDCLLVCESAEFLARRKALRASGFAGDIISSADLIFGHRFYPPDRRGAQMP